MHCHSQGKKVTVVANVTQCFCLNYIPYEKMVSNEDCLDFYLAGRYKIKISKNISYLVITECETGWTRFGDNCYKSLGTNMAPGMAQDLCMEEEANLFFPQSLEESQWIKSFLSGKKVQVGFKGYKNGIIYNMDNSENVGIRGITRNIITIQYK